MLPRLARGRSPPPLMRSRCGSGRSRRPAAAPGVMRSPAPGPHLPRHTSHAHAAASSSASPPRDTDKPTMSGTLSRPASLLMPPVLCSSPATAGAELSSEPPPAASG
eukprot:72629-Chlamydomonas_euryale.AAC.3